LGYALAVVAGVPFGIVMGAFPRLGDILQPYLYAIFATPRVVVVPLIVIWFGIGFEARLFLVFFWSAIAISVNTAQGVRHARPDLVEVARSFQVSRVQLARHVLIPGAVPFVLAGLRIGAERAIVGVIIGEMFLQIVGLGGIIAAASSELLPAKMLCAVAVIAAMGTILITALDLLERRFQSWKGA
jgi:NitT/TauT family transport system permease protein